MAGWFCESRSDDARSLAAASRERHGNALWRVRGAYMYLSVKIDINACGDKLTVLVVNTTRRMYVDS